MKRRACFTVTSVSSVYTNHVAGPLPVDFSGAECSPCLAQRAPYRRDLSRAATVKVTHSNLAPQLWLRCHNHTTGMAPHACPGALQEAGVLSAGLREQHQHEATSCSRLWGTQLEGSPLQLQGTEFAEKLLEESRKQTAQLQCLNNQVSTLADAMERQADTLERQLRPIAELAALMASFIPNNGAQFSVVF
nr:uncharacterized protein LOC129380373 [Dermacentor andersoni]